MPRTTRLRISCDARYPALAFLIIEVLQALLPDNRVSVVPRSANCFDVSCHSNHWVSLLGWSGGSKMTQRVSVPAWIAGDVREMMQSLGFRPRVYEIPNGVRHIHRVRLARDVDRLLALVNPIKS